MPGKKKMGEEPTDDAKVSMTGFSQPREVAPKRSFLTIISIGLLGTVILVWLGLWGYQNSLVKERNELIKRMEDLQNQRDLDLESNLTDLTKGIDNLKNILDTRIYSSYFFTMLEELTLPYVQFTKLNGDFSQAKLFLEVAAVDYKTLAKQIVVLEDDWRVKEIDLTSTELSDLGGITSNLEIELDPSFLRP